MKSIFACLFLLMIGLLLYFSTLRGVWGDGNIKTPNISAATMPLESSHEKAPYTSMLSLAERNTFELTREQADFSSPDVGISKGHFFSFFPPGISVWIMPFYQLGRNYNLAQVFAYFSIAIFSVLTLILIFKISNEILKLPISLALFNSLIFGFASTSWSYSSTIYQHATSTFLIIFGFYAVWRFSHSKMMAWVWGSLVWICYGLSIFVDYPNALLFMPVMFYFLFKSVKFKKVGEIRKLSIGLVIIVTSIFFFSLAGLHAYYNQQNYGNWRVMSNVLPRYDKNNIKDPNADIATIEKQNTKGSNFQVFSETSIVFGLYELLVADDKGLLYFSPIYLIAILGIFVSFRNLNTEKSILLSLALLNILVYASFGDPYGGWAFGPRYIIPAMAFLSFFVGIFLNEFKFKFISKLIAYLLFGYSCGVALLGAITTNLVPPRIEAIYYKWKYGWPFNIDYMNKGQTGSFVYNNYFHNSFDLWQYYWIIFGVIMIAVFIILFILPLFSRKGKQEVI